MHFCIKTGTFVSRNYLEKAESVKEKCYAIYYD